MVVHELGEGCRRFDENVRVGQDDALVAGGFEALRDRIELAGGIADNGVGDLDPGLIEVAQVRWNVPFGFADYEHCSFHASDGELVENVSNGGPAPYVDELLAAGDRSLQPRGVTGRRNQGDHDLRGLDSR